MNFFWLDSDPTLSARYNVDKHVVKLGMEACQCLVTAFKDVNASSIGPIPYKVTHVDHPLCIWSRKSKANYLHLAVFA